MADKIKTVREVKAKLVFADADNRTLTLPNPKANLTAAEIKAVESKIKTDQSLIGDKTGAAFVYIESPVVVSETTRVTLDPKSLVAD